MDILGGSLFNYISTMSGVTTLAIYTIVIGCIVIVSRLTNLNIFGIIKKISTKIVSVSGKLIARKEASYHRDIAIGKISYKMRRAKNYRFLNDLIIDLGLKQLGATPYEFLYLTIVASFFLTILICQIVFNSLWMVIVMFPIVFAGVMCVLYTKANVAHDVRIESVIEAENIICNNIKDGVVVAIRTSLNVIPIQVRESFRNFLDNLEHKNYHIKEALLELNQNLGSISDDFIKKCIVFEMEEEHGIVGMFKDIVEINNIKMKMRTEMKRQFEEVVMEFIIGASMIFLFLGGVMATFPEVANFYLNTTIGKMILAIDALIIIGEFVYITYLKAKEI
ncbi:hypothetical protein M1146_04405 [Patescibacteria group bacterium]|nr:hypothetical protein [Patescibacteria group bacterium]